MLFYEKLHYILAQSLGLPTERRPDSTLRQAQCRHAHRGRDAEGYFTMKVIARPSAATNIYCHRDHRGHREKKYNSMLKKYL
jgi:hypothetical protein